MANQIFVELLQEKIINLKNAFKVSNIVFDLNKVSNKDLKTLNKDGEVKNDIFHNGEYGTYREAICREFLRYLIPQNIDASTGFIISPNEPIVSNQCDIVLYDKNHTPLVESNERKIFFPIETVLAVGEVKSDLDRSQLKSALVKLEKVKTMRESLINPSVVYRKNMFNRGKVDEIKDTYDPTKMFRDQIMTFIICNKLTFDVSNPKNFEDLYEPSVPNRRMYNMILSLEDGLFTWSTDGFENEEVMLAYPEIAPGKPMKKAFVSNDKFNNHIINFATAFFQNITFTTILFPDLVDYIGRDSIK